MKNILKNNHYYIFKYPLHSKDVSHSQIPSTSRRCGEGMYPV